jgi:hypothetical protein
MTEAARPSETSVNNYFARQYIPEGLRTWERKVLRKIYGPVYENGIWRIRTNKELMAMCQELDIVAEIKKARLRCLGHVERM